MRAFYALLLAGLLTGCTRNMDADEKQTAQQEKTLSEAVRQVGIPNIVNWQELKLVKRLYEIRDRADLSTFTYIVDLNGHLHFLTKSIGYGIPYATQFDNPQKIVYDYHTLPQAEPNGLFMPSQADGTWIMAVDEKGETHPMYVEPRVIVSPFKLPSIE